MKMRSVVFRLPRLAGIAALAVTVGLCTLLLARPPAEAVLAPARSLPVYSVETEEKVVALGINCAWDNADIPQLLGALDRAGVKATFFLLEQWAEKYPDSVLSIHAAGHEIASHSYSHTDLTTLSPQQIAQEAEDGRRVLEGLTGQPVTLLRPPSGAYNDTVIDTLRQQGFLPIQWDVDTLDWKGLSADEMLLRVMSRVENGSILLLHSGAPHTAEALPQLLDALKQEGYRLLPVGEMVYPPGSPIDVQGRQHPPQAQEQPPDNL